MLIIELLVCVHGFGMNECPLSWVLSPHPLPDMLPVTGVSYWKKRSDRWDTIILAKSGE